MDDANGPIVYFCKEVKYLWICRLCMCKYTVSVNKCTWDKCTQIPTFVPLFQLHSPELIMLAFVNLIWAKFAPKSSVPQHLKGIQHFKGLNLGAMTSCGRFPLAINKPYFFSLSKFRDAGY